MEIYGINDAVCISIEDEAYPVHLKDIKDPPKKLYCIGDTKLLKLPGIAVVGTRRLSSYGRWAAYGIGKKIAASGVTVVSGMAYGIDSCAHRGALDAGGSTIAVLGTAINVCYPRSNGDLYERIGRAGLIVSEYGPGEKTGAWSFPQRNRIIAGLSRSAVIVEGPVKSGAMITANYALEQGRDVFAVPGNIDRLNSEGTNMLIRDGAMPICSMESVEETLGLKKAGNEGVLSLFSEKEAGIYMTVKNFPGLDTGTLAFRLGIAAGEAGELVSSLEQKGFVKRSGGYIYPL